MISKSQLELIEKVKINNQKATERHHSGHKLTTQRWDERHTVKVCETCNCTVGLTENHTKLRKEFSLKYGNEANYRLIR